jgi:hypothetical protein
VLELDSGVMGECLGHVPGTDVDFLGVGFVEQGRPAMRYKRDAYLRPDGSPGAVTLQFVGEDLDLIQVLAERGLSAMAAFLRDEGT